jgi:2-dehydro-3-deoxygluconokinase
MTSRQGFSASHNTYKGFLFDGHQLMASNAYDIPDIIDRIGAGDAFMSGLMYGILHFSDNLSKAVEFATAAAVFKHYIKGDFNLCAVEEVEGLMSGNTGGKVKR